MSIYLEYPHELLPLPLTNSTSLLFFILRYWMCLSLCPSSQQQPSHNAPLCNNAAPVRDTTTKTPEQHNISITSLITIIIIYTCYYDKIPVNLRFPLLHSGDICLDLPPYIIPPWSIKQLPLNRKHSNSMQDLRFSEQSCWTSSSWRPEGQHSLWVKHNMTAWPWIYRNHDPSKTIHPMTQYHIPEKLTLHCTSVSMARNQ